MITYTLKNPFLSVESNIAYSANGDIIKCYRMELAESFASSEKDFDRYYDSWYKAIKDLAIGSIVLKQDVYLKKQFDTSSFPETNFFQRADKKHFSEKEFMEHTCYLFFIYTKTDILKNDTIRNPFKKLPSTKVVASKLNEIDQIFARDVDQTVEFLNATEPFHIAPLTEEEIKEYTMNYFNGFYTDRTTDTIKREKYYQIGNKLTGAYIVNKLSQLPDSLTNVVRNSKMSTTDYTFYKGYSDSLGLELNFDHVFNQVFYIEDHNTIKAEIKSKRELIFGLRYFSADNKTAAEKLDEYIAEISQDGKIRFIRAHFNVCFFAEDEAEFKRYDTDLSRVFKDMDIRPHVPVGNRLSNVFNSSFFGYVSNLDLDNTFIIDLQHATCMVPYTTNYKSDREGIYFNDRLFNIPIRKDIWDDDKVRIKARNFFIISSTGGGKGVLANHIFRQYYEQGTTLVINDLGDSYQKLSYLFEDTLYIRYKEGEPLGINPMYIAEGEELSVTQTNQILSFIALLWKRGQSLRTEEEVSLRKIIKCFYELIQFNHSFPIFYQFVQENKDILLEKLEIEYEYFRIDEFLHNCSEFVTGSYSFLFSTSEVMSYDIDNKKIVVFEYDEAKEDPLLLSILLLVSSEVTRRLCWLDKSKRGVVFFDEFAKFLKYDNVLNSVQYYYQAARKQECAIGTVLQSPTQLPENDTSESIIHNTQVLFIPEDENVYHDVKDRFDLDSHDLNQMMSMKSKFSGQVKYSEIFLKIGKESNVIRLECPTEALAAYQTDGKKNAKLMAIYDECKDMELAIQRYLNQD